MNLKIVYINIKQDKTKKWQMYLAVLTFDNSKHLRAHKWQISLEHNIWHLNN